MRRLEGPELENEFSSEVQDHVNNSRKRRALTERIKVDDVHEEGHTTAFQSMVFESIADEVPQYVRPTVKLVPPKNGNPPFAPRFEFVYTNRVKYADGIAPDQSPGCGCVGNCGDAANLGSCACRARQEKYCRQREDGDSHTDHKGFAYTDAGVIHPKVLDSRELIWCGIPLLLISLS